MAKQKVDAEKRKRVMERSMRLGHCVCDPKKPCPCDLLLTRDVCLCAGERLEAPAGPVRLTHLVDSAGCASKIDQASLKRVIEGLAFPDDPRVLVGAAVGDDAGVYQLDEHTAIVQTVDVFTPSVDDPYTFGQVAAANSVSDIYAMGGRPLTALSIVGFPIGTVADAVLHEILRGGIDKMAEAGVAVIGGHSIKDPEIKAGFAVTGVVDPDRVTLRAGARPGDVLILTKPLGTGILAFASQIDRAPAGAMEAAARSMTALNKTAAELMLAAGAHGCTDITGFGLMGHLAEMAAGGKVNVEVVWDDLPLLPGVLECAAEGIIPGAVERNRESCAAAVTLEKGATPAMLDVCMDAQTSGGLLIAIARTQAAALLKQLHKAGIKDAAVVGKVRGRGKGRVFLVTRGRRPIPQLGGCTRFAPCETGTAPLERPERCSPLFQEAEKGTAPPNAGACCCSEEETEMAKKLKPSACCSGESSCCAEGHGATAPATGSAPAKGGYALAETGGAPAIQAKFLEFLRTASAPGALDATTKQAMAIALSVVIRCDPCTRNHIRKARDMGFSQEQIDEAAWMGIAFGGSPVMMFYDAIRKGGEA